MGAARSQPDAESMLGGRRVRAVVFDLDGLLIDSEPVWRQAESDVLARRGITADPAVGRMTVGLSKTDTVAVWMARYPLDNVAELAEEVAAAYRARISAGVPLRPGAAETVRRLGARYPLAIASGSPLTVIRQVLAGLGWMEAFAALASGEDVPAGKPAPDVYLAAAAALGLPPAACVALEDSPVGARAALAAGMACLAVPSGDFTAGEYPPVDAVLPSLSRAVALLLP